MGTPQPEVAGWKSPVSGRNALALVLYPMLSQGLGAARESTVSSTVPENNWGSQRYNQSGGAEPLGTEAGLFEIYSSC